MKKKDDSEVMYLVPELNIKISLAWVNLVHYCQTRIPFGDIRVRIVNANPTELLEEKPKIRFDKEPTIPNP